MKIRNQLKHDLEEVKNLFPKLVYCTNKELRALKGDIDICDNNGQYWDTFRIVVTIPEKYPYAVPVLVEISEKIDRVNDRHLTKDGVCCVEMTHLLLYKAKLGIRMTEFIRDHVYPYLANQLYFDVKGNYANGEYGHYFEGIVEFYDKKLGLSDPNIIISIIALIIENKLPSRNSLCPCGKAKYKNCHEKDLEFLKIVGKDQLLEDLKGFKQVIVNQDILSP